MPEPDIVLEEGNKISILIKTKSIKDVVKKFLK